MKKTSWWSGFFLAGFLLCGTSTVASAQGGRGMAVPPERLPEGLVQTPPKDHFIPSDQKRVGVVHAMEGTVVVTHGTTKEAYFARAGDAVHEKDRLITLPASKCRIRFVDEDVVTMAPETEFSVESFEDQRAEGRKSSFFSMAKGRAMFYAMRLFRYRDTRLTLGTPTNTIGVRGTKFGAHVYYLENAKTASGPIMVADARDDMSPYLLAQAGAGRSFTDCFSEDGVLDVDGQTVAPGQMYSSRTGQVAPTPPEVIRSFQQATEIRAEGETGQPPAPAGTEEGAPPPTAVTGGVAPIAADIQENITSVIQVQTGRQTEVEQTPAATAPLTGPRYGYFSMMLLKGDDPAAIYDAFLSRYDTDPERSPRPPRLDQDLDAYAYAVVNTGSPDYLRVISSTGEPDKGQAYLEGELDSGELERSWTKHYLGQKSYTQWGYWVASQSTEFDILGTDYRFVRDKVWFLEGTHVTTAAEMPSGSYGYSGAAHGSYQGPGGVSSDLSGSFNCQVDFGSATVQNFSLNAGDGNPAHNVIINQSASASISRNSNGNYFYFSGGSGTATINGAASTFRVNGSLYGPQAQEIGGNWGVVNTGTQEGAAGVFTGAR